MYLHYSRSSTFLFKVISIFLQDNLQPSKRHCLTFFKTLFNLLQSHHQPSSLHYSTFFKAIINLLPSHPYFFSRPSFNCIFILQGHHQTSSINCSSFFKYCTTFFKAIINLHQYIVQPSSRPSSTIGRSVSRSVGRSVKCPKRTRSYTSMLLSEQLMFENIAQDNTANLIPSIPFKISPRDHKSDIWAYNIYQFMVFK